MEDIRFPMKVWNVLNMLHSTIVTEIDASNPDNRKWISICPLKDRDERGKYRYFEVELPKDILEKDLDWGSEDEIIEERFLKSIHDIYTLLEQKNIDPHSFDVPWKFDYPYAT